MTDANTGFTSHERLDDHKRRLDTIDTWSLRVEQRLDVHREQLDVLNARLFTCESKIDDVESDNKIAIEELAKRLLELAKQTAELSGLVKRLAKMSLPQGDANVNA